MAVAFDGETILAAHSASASSHTVTGKTTAGSDRVGVVRIKVTTPEFDNGGTTVTWGGVSMTQIGSGAKVASGTAGGVRAYRIVNPPTGASNIVITPAAGNSAVGYIVSSYSGVDQTTPVGTPATDTGSSTTPTVDVSAATDDMVLDMVTAAAPFSGSGGGQTIEGTPTDGSSYVARGSREAGATTVTMSHTISSANWATIGFALKAAGAGDPAPTITSVNGGADLTPGQAGFAILGSNFSDASGEVRQGADTYPLTINSEAEDELDADLPDITDPNPKLGTADIAVINADDQEDEAEVTFSFGADTDYVDVGTPATPGGGVSILSFESPSSAAGDQVAWRVTDLAFTVADFTLNDDLTFTKTEGLAWVFVEVNRRPVSTGIWEGWEAVEVDSGNMAPSFDGPDITDLTFIQNVAISPRDFSDRFSDTDSLTFSVVGTLPDGLTLSSAGVLTGTPTTLGTTSSLEIRADDGTDTTDSNSFSINIIEAPEVSGNGRYRSRHGMGLGLG